MPALTPQDILSQLAAKFGDAVSDLKPAMDPFVVVKGEKIVDVCRFLHDDPGLAMDFLEDVTATDHPKEKLIRVVYHLWSYKLRHGVVLKVELDRTDAKVPTVDPVWKAANWLEREVYDLFGVTFVGHPDLRRIMLPDDWVGHPLRKDYSEAGGWHGMTNIRDNPLDQFLSLDQKNREKFGPPTFKPPPPRGGAAAGDDEADEGGDAA
jgi:NADH-quinone oxidoreductase subunit C